MALGNPALSEKMFQTAGWAESDRSMTMAGTVHKAFILTGLLLLAGAVAWSRAHQMMEVDSPSPPTGWMIGSALVGFAIALLTIFQKRLAPVTAPIYALVEGVFLGLISSFMENAYPGIVTQAVALTCATLVAMLAAWRFGLIKVTEKFRAGVTAAVGAVMLVYLASLVLRLFGATFPFIHESGPIGIGFSILVLVLASLSLVLDFDAIEQGARRQAPRFMEWYCAFGLMVTLVWLYLEFLRLLSKLRR